MRSACVLIAAGLLCSGKVAATRESWQAELAPPCLCPSRPILCSECPRAPHNREAQARILDPPAPAAIAASQREATCERVPGGLIPQLAACLAAQQNVPAGVGYRALLCGGAELYQGEAFDGGWGKDH